jgi:hypothetical protein
MRVVLCSHTGRMVTDFAKSSPDGVSSWHTYWRSNLDGQPAIPHTLRPAVCFNEDSAVLRIPTSSLCLVPFAPPSRVNGYLGEVCVAGERRPPCEDVPRTLNPLFYKVLRVQGSQEIA